MADRREYYKQYYQKHKTEKNAYSKDYIKAHRAEINERLKQRRQEANIIPMKIYPKVALKKERLEMGLSIENFSELIGLHWSTYSQIERGIKVTLRSANKVADALKRKFEDLFDVVEG